MGQFGRREVPSAFDRASISLAKADVPTVGFEEIHVEHS